MDTNEKGDEVTVTYRWVAHSGKGAELKELYQQVVEDADKYEEGTLRFDVYEENDGEVLLIVDVFQNAEALGAHLGGTARKYFPQLLEVATPGPFFFCGNVPEELQMAAKEMGLEATFATHAFGLQSK